METDIEYLKDYITLLTADTRPLELKETGQKELAKAIETVLNALDNSISKDKIRAKIEYYENALDDDFADIEDYLKMKYGKEVLEELLKEE